MAEDGDKLFLCNRRWYFKTWRLPQQWPRTGVGIGMCGGKIDFTGILWSNRGGHGFGSFSLVDPPDDCITARAEAVACPVHGYHTSVILNLFPCSLCSIKTQGLSLASKLSITYLPALPPFLSLAPFSHGFSSLTLECVLIISWLYTLLHHVPSPI